MPDRKMLVPRNALLSLAGFLRSETTPTNAFNATTTPTVNAFTRQAAVQEEDMGWAAQPNPFALFRAAAGGQGVELATLSSTLGSTAHLAAMSLALQRRPDLPTALLPDTATAPNQWSAVAEYVAHMPAVCAAVGRALIEDLVDSLAAVEFPVYWLYGLADGKFVYSRVDAITVVEGGGDDGPNDSGKCYSIWEFKTKWGQSHCYERQALSADLRQAVLYAYMFQQQTGNVVRSVHVRYARIAPGGQITRYTHTYAFDPVRFRSVLAHALSRTTAYVDANFALTDRAELEAVVRAVGSAVASVSTAPTAPPTTASLSTPHAISKVRRSPRHHQPSTPPRQQPSTLPSPEQMADIAFPPYQVLQMVRRAHLLPLSQVYGLPPIRHRHTWFEHPGMHTLYVRGASTMIGGEGQHLYHQQAGTSHLTLDKAVKERGTALAELVSSTVTAEHLAARLARLYGPPRKQSPRKQSPRNSPGSGRSRSPQQSGSPQGRAAYQLIVIRCLNRGINAMALGDSTSSTDPAEFLHASRRHLWSKAALARALCDHLPVVADQVRNEILSLS